MLCQLSYRGVIDENPVVGYHYKTNIVTDIYIKKNIMVKETKSGLHVRESNPGRLRDRQKCYQLHQRGNMMLNINFFVRLATHRDALVGCDRKITR